MVIGFSSTSTPKVDADDDPTMSTNVDTNKIIQCQNLSALIVFSNECYKIGIETKAHANGGLSRSTQIKVDVDSPPFASTQGGHRWRTISAHFVVANALTSKKNKTLLASTS
jgi:hypothetical protein